MIGSFDNAIAILFNDYLGALGRDKEAQPAIEQKGRSGGRGNSRCPFAAAAYDYAAAEDGIAWNRPDVDFFTIRSVREWPSYQEHSFVQGRRAAGASAPRLLGLQ